MLGDLIILFSTTSFLIVSEKSLPFQFFLKNLIVETFSIVVQLKMAFFPQQFKRMYDFLKLQCEGRDNF